MTGILLFFLALAAQTGAPSPAPAPPAEPYNVIKLADPDVRSAAAAIREITLRRPTIITAERHAVSSSNIRLCITSPRDPNREFAQVTLSRNDRTKKWDLMVWSWGSCGR